MDNTCFVWAVIAALYSAERNAERKSSYSGHTTVLNLKNIEFPMTLNQIKKFENLNDISINVFCIEKKEILPIQLTNKKMEKHVNLLYIQDDNARHFAWIKNLSRLVSSQISRKEHKKFFCDRYVNM